MTPSLFKLTFSYEIEVQLIVDSIKINLQIKNHILIKVI